MPPEGGEPAAGAHEDVEMAVGEEHEQGEGGQDGRAGLGAQEQAEEQEQRCRQEQTECEGAERTGGADLRRIERQQCQNGIDRGEEWVEGDPVQGPRFRVVSHVRVPRVFG